MSLQGAGAAWAGIGVVSLTDGSASVVPGSTLTVGQTITTGSDGRAHFMLTDGSAVTIGPNSAVTVEKYAYQPDSKTGELTLGVRQGTIRIVGGAISKTAAIDVRTPASTITLRGIAAITVDPSGGANASLLHGSTLRVTSQGVAQTVSRSGSQIVVPAGGPPRAPVLASADQLTSVHALDRRPAVQAPTPTSQSVDTALARSGLGLHNSGVAATPPPIAVRSPPTTTRPPSQHVAATQARQQLVASQQSAAGIAPTPARPAAIAPPIASPPAIVAATAPPKAAGTTASAGILTPTGSNTFTGSTTIGSASLRSTTGTGTLTSTSANVTLVGVIGGTFMPRAGGTVTLTGTNAYSGGTTISAGRLQIGSVAFSSPSAPGATGSVNIIGSASPPKAAPVTKP